MFKDARRARVGVSVVFAVCGAAFATWAARIPAAQQRLGISTGELAIALFGLAVGSVITLAIAGALITKIGSRACTFAGSTILSLGLVLVCVAPDLPLFTAALFVLGSGNSLVDVSMNAHAARVEGRYDRPIFASFHAFWNVGGLAGSGLGAFLAKRDVSITVHFTIAALALLVIAWLAAGTCFLTGPDQGQGGAAFSMPSRALLPLGLLAFCAFVAEGTVNDWSAVYLTDVTMASPATASLGYFSFCASMIAVRLAADRLVQKISAPRVIRISTVVAVLGFGLALTVPTPVAGVIAFALIGVGISSMVPLAWSAASRLQPESPSQAISAVATLGYLGFLTGPLIIGGLAHLTGLRPALLAAVLITATVYLLAPHTETTARPHSRQG